MSKIFRLHTGTTQNIEHWQQLPNYIDSTAIDTIQDPSGLNAQTQITSIPSPFARMDLIKTAFNYVTAKKNLDGVTIYHRMVSDCLDVAEIFFNIESLNNKIEILEWDSGIYMNGGVMAIREESDLGKLLQSSNQKHRLLGETLKMYLFQDKKHFNFGQLKHLYLLNYKHGPEPINVIGGTSPTTLFFSSANDLSFVDISFGNDKLFDSIFCPLHKRIDEFIKYCYALRSAFSNFSEIFAGFNKYLDLVFLSLDPSLRNVIRDIERNSEAYENLYNNIPVNAAGNFAEILGVKLKTKKLEKGPGLQNDFIIQATKNIIGDIPCILPIDAFNEELKFGGGIWQKDWYKSVPKADKRPLDKRTLPHAEHITYPYLTVSDLLEPYIIKVPYPTDNDKFFNGNYEIKQGEQDHGYILPIKKQLFEYFSLKDIQGLVSDGKKMFELRQDVGGVSAILRIPIKGNKYVQLSRNYIENKFQDKIQKADEENNIGVISDNQFTIAVYPFIKLPNELNPHYRVMLVDRDIQPVNKHYTYSLNFYSDTNSQVSLPVNLPSQRSSKFQVQKVTTNYYIVENSYDFIEVKNNIASGIIIPLFKNISNPSNTFKFAIDFGTTNTHVEYKENGGSSHPFDITINDTQIATLYNPSDATDKALTKVTLGIGADDLINIIKEEFIPFTIEKNSSYKFPQRTVISDNGSFNPDQANFALADFNIPFWYLKENSPFGSIVTANLKWVDFKNNKKAERRTRAFLKQLMLMIRNKVLLNGGSLSETEIVWFYPSSMPTFRRKILESAWKEFYSRYFGDHSKLYKLSESFAPFYYYYHKEGVRPHERPAVNIDIGGGTTDIVIYQNENPVLLSSFRFAANTIFGDGYGYTANDNGFIQKYEPIIKNSLSNTSAQSLKNIYDGIKQKNNSSIELCEFFFSLEENKLIKDNKINLSLSKFLTEDNEFKLVFIFFYSAIIYHIANLMKAKNLKIPQFITFSGNGAKLINIAGGGKDLSTLKEFTRIIFNDVYGSEQNISLEFRMFDNPKEITCKGGLECTDYAKFEAVEKQILNVLIGIDKTSTIPPSELKYNQLEDNTIESQVKTEVSDFADRFFRYNSKFNFFDNFGISPKNLENYKALLKDNISNDLISGIKEKLEEVNDNSDTNIEETLFFYPLKGYLNKLAFQIYNDHK